MIACRIAQWTADIFGSAWASVVFGLLTIGNALWFLASPNQLSGALLLSFAALWASAGIQYTGTRDTKALQAKLDEIVRAVPDADNRLMGIERDETANVGVRRG